MGDNRGGPRQGTIGEQYPQRSDMRAPGAQITPSNMPSPTVHGQGVQQAAALRAVPTAGSPSPSPTSSPSAQPVLGPGDVPSLQDPTANPNEPVTAGLPVGPGAGPEALGLIMQDSPELAIAKALYLEYPNPDLRRYIAFLEDSLQI